MDITVDEHLAGQGPASHNARGSDNELADEHPILETNRKSHFEIISESPVRASNRKSNDEDTPRSSISYTKDNSALVHSAVLRFSAGART